MGTKDSRYDLIKPMLSQGQIQTFADIFKYIKKTVVANDMGKKVDRFTIMMAHPKKFSVGDVYEMADLFSIEAPVMFDLIYKEGLKNSNDQE